MYVSYVLFIFIVFRMEKDPVIIFEEMLQSEI